MPHLHIDYSPNLEQRVDMARLCKVLAEAAIGTGVFPAAGVRVRATPCAHVYMADGNPDHAYLDLSVRLRGGRSLDVRKAATQAIFDALHGYCRDTLESSSLMLSMEMRDIDPDLSPKASSIRSYLPESMS